MKEHSRDILDHLLEGCQVISPDWRYVYVNQTVTKQGHKTSKQLLGHTMTEVYPGIDQTEMFSHLQDCMKTRKPSAMENEFTFPDGSKGYFELRIEPVPEGVLIFSIDITERKQMEQAQKEFLVLASHHLRTPLSIVNMYTELLGGGMLGSLHPYNRNTLARLPALASKLTAWLINY